MPTVEEIRAGRPREPEFARTALIVAVVLWAPLAQWTSAPGAYPGVAVIALFCVVFGAFGVVKGRRAARTVTTVAVVVSFLLLGWYCWAGFDDPRGGSVGFAVVDIVAVALSVFALTQLYHPNTSRYIREVENARR